MQSLVDILKKLQGRYPGFGKRLDESEALSRWETAVGPNIARHSRAIRVQDGVLWVEVDHPIWKSELHHRKRQLLDILNNAASAATAGKAGGKLPILTDLFFVDPRAGRAP